MKPTVDEYPVFEANQVLTNRHLNMIVDYLDEQERLTRANLVGIGIVCGLELEINTAADTVSFTKGCAVTSEGYLITEPEDVLLTSYRTYELPTSDPYSPFMVGGVQIPLWELVEDGTPSSTLLSSPATFLNDKVVLLFVELDREDLSDCSPNNCDDKGAEVSVTIRRLVMTSAHAKQVFDDTKGFDEQLQLKLPDVRVPRYDVPRTNLITTRQVLEAFQNVVKSAGLVTTMQKALNAAYVAFRPLLMKDHPTSPFNGFTSKYGFLESLPTSISQVGFMQYYVDVFEDIISAYDAFRTLGLELSCECVPDDALFPRHVFLGDTYRTGWTPSPASCCDCEDLREEVIRAFARLVAICTRFSDQPSLAPSSTKTKIDTQIRITPSRLGSPLSRKSIPYFYELTGTPPIYELWSNELAGRGRSNQNLGYRSTDYVPTAPTFVTQALTYDLESYNFFRIEGHIGKDWRRTLASIQYMRDTYRLPFDIVAVRTGEFDESIEIDPDDYECYFRDLEAMYDALRLELICLARKSLATFGRLKLTRTLAMRDVTSGMTGTTSVVSTDSPLYKELVEKYFSEEGTVGLIFAERISKVGFTDVALPGASSVFNTTLTSMALLVRFTLMLEDDLYQVNWEEFEKTFSRLKKLAEEVSAQQDGDAGDDDISWSELNRQIISVVYACRIDGFLSIRDEYVRRLREVKRLQYFSYFVRKHPGIQHKAGVPVGGTFILVYHEGEEDGDVLTRERFTNLRAEIAERLEGDRRTEFDSFTLGRSSVKDIYDPTIETYQDGRVIADFFLPYLCCSDCPPVQYIVQYKPEEEPPAEPPVLTATTECTSPNNVSIVSLTVAGGTAPYQLSVDGAALQPLPVSIPVTPGTHTLQVTDAEGLQSTAISITVAEQLLAGDAEYMDDVATGTYSAVFTISGGKAPYVVSSGSVSGNTVTAGPLDSGSATTVLVTDAAGCTTTVTLQHVVESGCDKPCGGKALRCRYPAWVPVPPRTGTYAYKIFESFKLEIQDENGIVMLAEDFTSLARQIFGNTEITIDLHDELMTKFTTELSAAIASKVGNDSFIVSYDKAEGGTLVIERYDCHIYSMSLSFMISGSTGSRGEQWTYKASGVAVRQVEGGEGRYTIPPFGCISLDKCDDIVGQDCRVNIISIVPKQGNGVITLTPTFDTSVDPGKLRYFWRVDTPTMVFSTQPSVNIPLEGVRSLNVQLVVVDPNGCWDYINAQLTTQRTTPLRLTNRLR